MAGDLGDLFGAVDAGELMADLQEYGVMAASAVAANVGFGFASRFALSKWPTAPAWVKNYGVPGAAIVLGALGGGYVSRYNRQAGLGVGVGLVSAGLTQLVKGFFPAVQFAGLGDETMVLPAGNPYGRYLSGATTTYEPMNGLGNPPMIEQMTPSGSFAPSAPSFDNGMSGLASFIQ